MSAQDGSILLLLETRNQDWDLYVKSFQLANCGPYFFEAQGLIRPTRPGIYWAGVGFRKALKQGRGRLRVLSFRGLLTGTALSPWPSLQTAKRPCGPLCRGGI